MMSKGVQVLTKCLIGYNKKQVDEYIEEIVITHQKTVNFLKDNIENCRQEKERLLSELYMIKSFNHKEEKSKELLELALKRADKTIALINKMMKEDIEKIIEDAKNKIIIHEKQAQDLDRDIAEQKARIDYLLNDVQLVFHENKVNMHQEDETEVHFTVRKSKEKEDIKKVRENNIVGKIAGVDLLDQKGNLIVARNSVISLDAVNQAEKEGKLVELIVNMS